MANTPSYTRVAASGNTNVYSVPFPYLSRGHVYVTVGGVQAAFTFQTDNQVFINTRPTAGALVLIYRQTPTSPLVDFQPGSLDPDDLDAGFKQALFVAQEALDAILVQAGEGSSYTVAETNALLDPKADKADTYTKSGIDTRFVTRDMAIALKANVADVYDKAASDTFFGTRDTAIAAKMAKANNLSDLVSIPAARTNLGLGSAALADAARLVPAGGSVGQVLGKTAAGDYALGWLNPSAGGVTLAQVKAERSCDINVVTDYGAVGDGSTNNTPAFNNAFAALRAAGGGRLYIPRGLFYFNSSLDITNLNNVVIEGAGIDATNLIFNGGDGNDFFRDNNGSFWRTFRDFSVGSSIARTAGAMFYLQNEKRGLFDRVKITGHFNGIYLYGFEQTELRSVLITVPSGAGSAVIAGHAVAGGLSGVNLLINSCFFRGFNDFTQSLSSLIGLYGLQIVDAAAVFGVNTDWSAFVYHDVLINGINRVNDHYFSQCFFDSTALRHCVQVQGAGLKEKISFNGCWFGGGGQYRNGATEGLSACGFFAPSGGTNSDWQFNGCRFIANQGSGLLLTMLDAEVMVTGCTFNACGLGGSINQGGVFWAPPTAATTKGPMIVANRFRSCAGGGVRFSNEANKHVVTNNVWDTAPGGAGTNTNVVNNFLVA